MITTFRRGTVFLVFWAAWGSGLLWANEQEVVPPTSDNQATSLANDKKELSPDQPLSSVTAEAPLQAIKQIYIGVLAFRGEHKAVQMWGPTAQYLSQSIPNTRFTIVPLSNENINQAVAGGRIQMVLTNPVSYAGLEASQGITRILTLKHRRLGKAYTRFGALIFTMADRDDINVIHDLAGKHLLAVHKDAFGGWLMAREVLHTNGIGISDLGRLEFAGFPQDKIVQAVANGEADAGTIRTDVLERMAAEGKIDIKKFKVINQHHHPGFPFLHSSPLYPEWPLAITSNISDDLAQQVAIALLRLAENDPVAKAANSAGWTVPLDYQPVHDLLMKFRLGPYTDLGKITPLQIIHQYKYWVLAISLAFLLLLTALVYIFRLNRHLEFVYIDRDNAKRAEHLQALRIRKLYEVISSPGLTLDEQINATLKFGCRTLGLEMAEVCRIDSREDTNTIENVIAPAELNLYPGRIIPLVKSLSDVVYHKEKFVAIRDLGNSEYRNHPSVRSSPMRSYVAVPIFVNGAKYGTVNFSSRKRRKREFDATERDLVNVIAKWISVSIEREQSRASEVGREAAERANDAKSQFIAHMSHEIRTPLTAILGFAESCQSSEQSEQERWTAMNAIVRNGKHLLQLINNILDFSKIEAKQLTIEKTRFSPVDLLVEIESLSRLQATDKGLSFEVVYDFPLPKTIFSDELRVKQILLNLCSNAIKFTEKGRVELKLSCDPPSQKIIFSVTDSGIGISPQGLTHIFEPYVQDRADRKSKTTGTGLGLALSKQLVDRLEGSIKVSSKPEIGSRFDVTIGTGDLSNVSFVNEIKPSQRLALQNPRISTKFSGHVMLVEDTLDTQLLLRRFLEKAGLTVTVADNGKQAVGKALIGAYDLILMDIRMPVMDGIEATKVLRRGGFTRPIVALTANAMKEEKDQCLQAGCDDFMTKPVDRRKLYELLGNYLSVQKSEQEIVPLQSLLLKDEPEYADLVERFVNSFPDKLAELYMSMRAERWEKLTEQAHQLKGVGGMHGYPLVSEVANSIRQNIREKKYSRLPEQLDELQRLSIRMRFGLNSNQARIPPSKTFNLVKEKSL